MTKLLGFALMTALATSGSAADNAPIPPVAKIVPKEITTLGEKRVDNYFWLREKTNPEVLQYLEAENKYTAEMMKTTEALQKKLYDEILARIKQTDLSVPVRQGDYFYYTRTQEGKQYAINCRKKGSLNGAEEILIDQNELAKGQKYFNLGGFQPSPNHKLIAYATDTEGDEVLTIYIKDLETGKLLADRITGAYYGIEWGNDNKSIFYTVLDKTTKRPYQCFRHTLGAKSSEDVKVYQEDDERYDLSLGKSRSQQFIVIALSSFTSTEQRYLDANHPASEWKVLLPRQKDRMYDLEHHGDSFYIRINDQGKNYRLVKAPVKDPSPANWKEVIPYRESVMLEDVNAFRDHLAIVERERGLRKLRIENLKNHQTHYVEFPEQVYTFMPMGNPEFNTRLVRFNYSSLVTPASVFDYDMDTHTRELKKQQEVLGGYDPTRYESVRVYAAGKGGVEVPISLVYKKGLQRNGKNPTLLYGYGSYGISMDPNFSSERLSLLDRGFVYAIAHIRGGTEMGKPWHEDGKMLKKVNTFTDFIASAEKLIKDGYTSADHLAIMGGSAGGMLMGAVANMRPDLFKAVIAKVPFVDVLNTATDPTLPLTVQEYEEWGNSNEKPVFDYIRSYSPYDNVKKQAYPNMLITGGLNDPRVSYWEPAKWTAKLRAMKTDNNLLLLKINMGAGHFGASGRYERIKETALDYAFLLHVMGLD